MTLRKSLLLSVIPWVAGISLLHAWLNLDLFRRAQSAEHPFKVGFLPVT
jgi:hypothetical protein